MHLGRDKAYKIANIVIFNKKRKTPSLPSNAVPLGISDIPSGFSDMTGVMIFAFFMTLGDF